jgi:hypothetical protein
MAQQDRTQQYLWLMANHMAQFLPKDQKEADQVICLLQCEQRYVRRVGNYIFDILPESDRRAEMVLAHVKQHLHERDRGHP